MIRCALLCFVVFCCGVEAVGFTHIVHVCIKNSRAIITVVLNNPEEHGHVMYVDYMFICKTNTK